MQNILIVIVGPTGVGKSRLAIDVARHFNTEIISCDSRQFYREMTIGTAVPPPGDLRLIKHHFVQHLSVNDYYSASRFEADAIEAISSLFISKPVAVMAGGSGLYINAVCGSIDEIPDTLPEVRELYLRKLDDNGIESLRSELKLVDPEYYSETDIRNHKRILRALEVYGSTGKKYSSFIKKGGKERDFRIIKIGLNTDRRELYQKINQRVDLMIEEGLMEEARSLMHLRHLNALNTVGYKELFDHFDGKTGSDIAIENIKMNSRRYAKRQLTWWARDKEITWFNPADTAEIIKFIENSSAS